MKVKFKQKKSKYFCFMGNKLLLCIIILFNDTLYD